MFDEHCLLCCSPDKRQWEYLEREKWAWAEPRLESRSRHRNSETGREKKGERCRPKDRIMRRLWWSVTSEKIISAKSLQYTRHWARYLIQQHVVLILIQKKNMGEGSPTYSYRIIWILSFRKQIYSQRPILKTFVVVSAIEEVPCYPQAGTIPHLSPKFHYFALSV